MSVPAARALADGQRCRVHVFDTLSGKSEVVYETTDILLEAPNWTQSGELILNGGGTLWGLHPSGTASLRPLPITQVPTLNNDHVLDPGGEHIFVSANDWQIYRASLSGGPADQITDASDGLMHFLHGVSPDGMTLAYIGLTVSADQKLLSANLRTVGVDGSGDTLLYSDGIADGSEYSPDGHWIYFNTEQFSSEPGHAQIARIRIDGTAIEQLTYDERVNWFPHISPNGAAAVYLSFPRGTTGHPADLRVRLHLVRDQNWGTAETLLELDGGQGTLNVNSWAPDSRRFAYVDYPSSK